MHIIINERLKFIGDFLESLQQDVALEWREVNQRNKRGEFSEYQEYEAAMDFPLFREQFAARAVINELNSLAEELILTVAEPFYREDQIRISNEGISVPIWELPIGKAWKIIENNYNICRDDISGWNAYDELRDTCNAFKHRRGFRRLSDIISKGFLGSKNVQHQATFENARTLLNAIKPFLLGIWNLKPKKRDALVPLKREP